MKLEVIIEKGESGYYVAEVPALPGCISQGKTVDETVINLGTLRKLIRQAGISVDGFNNL